MKKLVLTASLLALAASPAFAKDKAGQAEANKSHRAAISAPAIGSQTVVSGGRILGQDPDPAIRLEIARQGEGILNAE